MEKARNMFIIRNKDDTFTICFTAVGNVMPTPDDSALIINQDELIQLARSLEDWRQPINRSQGAKDGWDIRLAKEDGG
jgi:hypothetical protein